MPKVSDHDCPFRTRPRYRPIEVIQRLSRARDIATVQDIVRTAARRLTGATFVLCDGGQCHYVDEDAVGPLWKGQKFPMSACVSGWAMLNKQTVVIQRELLQKVKKFNRYERRRSKVHAHLPPCVEAKEGDIATIAECRHIAKTVSFVVVQTKGAI